MQGHQVHKADIALVYQDLDATRAIVKEIESLSMSFQSHPLNENTLEILNVVQPKVLLVLTGHLITSIEFYISFLEQCQQSMPAHYSVLLTSNKEAHRAFIACENGLFDNYAVVNPLHEPQRLPLIIMHALQVISDFRGAGLAKLLAQGHENLAQCIEQGASIREGMQNKLQDCENAIVESTNEVIQSEAMASQVQARVASAIGQFKTQLNEEFAELVNQLHATQQLQQQVIKTSQAKDYSAQAKLYSHANALPKKDERTLETPEQKSNNTQPKLLIAESSHMFARVLSDIFIRENFTVKLSETGAETLAMVHSFKPDVVLLEYKFNDMNGLEVAKGIREAGLTTSIIVLSSIKERAIVKKWVPLGIGAYIVKPSTQNTILNAVLHEIAQPTQILKPSENYDSIKWIPEYSVNNAVIDEQHKALFSIMNEYLYESEEEANLIATFEKLKQYIAHHFATEEQLLRDHQYPQLEEHIAKHRALGAKLEQMQSKLTSDSFAIQEKIGIFLYKWLTNHILKSDMHYKNYFEAHPKK